MSRDFLFEIGCEELPSGSMLPLAKALESHVIQSLQDAQLSFETHRIFATPRRLAILITALQEKQSPQTVLRRGPTLRAAYDPDGKPTAALLGFARSCGVSHKDLIQQVTSKGTWLSYQIETTGKETKDLLADCLQQALTALPIKKMMHWGQGEHAFVRPVHWVVMLWGEEVLAAEFFGIKTDRNTFGHRFHHPQAIPLRSPEDYLGYLQKAFVIADFSERRASIKEQIIDLASQHQATVTIPDSLLDEVTSIVEWPVALYCKFSSEFLTVPHEALVAAIQSHQKCFPLENNTGQLLSSFIAISNIHSEDKTQVIRGNEKVMQARLSDAAFFFNVDKKRGLSAFINTTKSVLFQEKLGSLYNKTERLSVILKDLSTPLNLNPQEVTRAVILSKCDLMTGMVGEFPELEGIMGYYYAMTDKEALPVAIALKEQYLPRFSGDVLPSSPLGTALSLADRLDTLAGIFALGYRASGVKDPYKLRRHALAIARLLIRTSAYVSLPRLLAVALNNFTDKLLPTEQIPSLIQELTTFIFERLQSYYQSNGLRLDCFQAVKAKQTEWLYDFDRRLMAITEFAHSAEATALAAGSKRVTRLLQQTPKLLHLKSEVNEKLFEKPEEKTLWSSLKKTQTIIEPLYVTGDYPQILTMLAALREPIDAFFDQVMIRVDNVSLKHNRLLLLSKLEQALQGVAAISLLHDEARLKSV